MKYTSHFVYLSIQVFPISYDTLMIGINMPTVLDTSEVSSEGQTIIGSISDRTSDQQ